MALHEREWPGNVIDYIDPATIQMTKDVREITGVAMIPSPVEEAHVRFEDGTSQHAVGRDGKKRLSTGTDLFLVRNFEAAKVWLNAQRVASLGGFGIYFDTVLSGEKRVMIHVDTRPSRVMWLCPSRDRSVERRSYINFNAENPGPYLDLLSAELTRL